VKKPFNSCNPNTNKIHFPFVRVEAFAWANFSSDKHEGIFLHYIAPFTGGAD
jgi:hypothetical protein